MKYEVVFRWLIGTLLCCVSTFTYAEHFIVLADIHFDPFISCSQIPCPLINKLKVTPIQQWASVLQTENQTPHYLSDTNFSLLDSTLRLIQKTAQQQQANFVLILGDSLGHDLRRSYKKYTRDKSYTGYQSFIKKLMNFIDLQIALALPNIKVFPLIGNNDTYQRDYRQQPNGAFFQDVLSDFAKLSKQSVAEFSASFTYGGYYSVLLQPGLRLIALNSTWFSNKNRSSEARTVANKELAWLRDNLSYARNHNEKVLIAMHIPPTYDIYVFEKIRLFTLLTFWLPEYRKEFAKLLNQFAPEISGIFMGHLHTNFAHRIKFEDHSIPFYGAPAISPIFGNYPTFKSFSINADGEIATNGVYYLPLKKPYHWFHRLNFN